MKPIADAPEMSRFSRAVCVYFIVVGVGVASTKLSAEWFLFAVLAASPGMARWTLSRPAAAAVRRRLPLSARRDLRSANPRAVVANVVCVGVMILGYLLMAVGASASSRSAVPVSGVLLFAGGIVGLIVVRTGSAATWWARRRRARLGAAHPAETWTWDRRWDERGEKRTFARYLGTRWVFAGRFAALFAALSLRLPPSPESTVIKLTLAVPTAFWLWRVWRVLGMGSAYLGFLKFPFHPGERAEFTLGVSDGGAEIRDATLTLRHFRESRDGTGAGGGLPLCTLAVEESGAPAPRDFLHGVDQRVAFDVPADAPGTAISSAHPSYWEVEVRGRTREGLYEERFFVPVYERPRTDAVR